MALERTLLIFFIKNCATLNALEASIFFAARKLWQSNTLYAERAESASALDVAALDAALSQNAAAGRPLHVQVLTAVRTPPRSWRLPCDAARRADHRGSISIGCSDVAGFR
jgi:hypothetical protein